MSIDYNSEPFKLSCSLNGDYAEINIRVELWDVTSSPVTLLRRSHVLNQSRSQSGSKTYQGKPSISLFHKLQANRIYVIRLIQEGSDSCVGSITWDGQRSKGWTIKEANKWIKWYDW